MNNELIKNLRTGPKGARELLGALSVSQPTLNRKLAPLIEQERVIRLGRARATRYGLVRNWALSEELLPVYQIDSKGQSAKIADLIPIAPDGFALRVSSPAVFPAEERFYESLPFFLQQLRPEGFLGRILAKQAAELLPLSTTLQDWTEDDVALYAARRGEDLSGSMIVGVSALERFLRAKSESLSRDDVEEMQRRADLVLRGEPAGSSVGGEQPKFTALLHESPGGRRYHAIVKFSAPDTNDQSLRWRDLLISEHHALCVLREFDFPASPSRLLEWKEQVFLEIERYDRVGDKGRRPYLALGYVEDEFSGRRDNVRDSLRRLARRNLLSEADRYSAEVVSLFGDFIGNTDQHFGNTSLTWDPIENTGFRCAPAYDISPMWYAPRTQGTIVSDLHEIPVELPELREAFQEARAMARVFWQRVSDDPRISENFRKIVAVNARRIEA